MGHRRLGQILNSTPIAKVVALSADNTGKGSAEGGGDAGVSIVALVPSLLDKAIAEVLL
jgi:hypothetical protein